MDCRTQRISVGLGRRRIVCGALSSYAFNEASYTDDGRRTRTMDRHMRRIAVEGEHDTGGRQSSSSVICDITYLGINSPPHAH